MKPKTMYKCDHCRKTMATVKGMERHEAQCLHNPEAFNCYNCACAHLGDCEDDYGYTSHDVPVCAYESEIIRENRADRCDAYIRTDCTYHGRNSKEAEDAVDKYLAGFKED